MIYFIECNNGDAHTGSEGQTPTNGISPGRIVIAGILEWYKVQPSEQHYPLKENATVNVSTIQFCRQNASLST